MSRFYFSILFFVSLTLLSQNNKIKEPVNTGVNMTVAILAVDSFIEVGDTIIALYKLDDMNYKNSNPVSNPNNFGIGGLTVWKGERLAIALWGNDSTSETKDGFLNNEAITWVILKNQKYMPIQLIYRVGENTWKPNGISIVDYANGGC